MLTAFSVQKTILSIPFFLIFYILFPHKLSVFKMENNLALLSLYKQNWFFMPTIGSDSDFQNQILVDGKIWISTQSILFVTFKNASQNYYFCINLKIWLNYKLLVWDWCENRSWKKIVMTHIMNSYKNGEKILLRISEKRNLSGSIQLIIIIKYCFCFLNICVPSMYIKMCI